MANLNPFALFKKGYTYGEILLYLYANPADRCSAVDIRKHVSKVTDSYYSDVIKWLVKDKLIVLETFQIKDSDPPKYVGVYRISYQGFSFIKDLKEKRLSRIINTIGILVACASIVVSSIINIESKNSTSKVEIIKMPYLNINKHDIAPPINKPCKTPIIIAGKSDTVHGKP